MFSLTYIKQQTKKQTDVRYATKVCMRKRFALNNLLVLEGTHFSV